METTPSDKVILQALQDVADIFNASSDRYEACIHLLTEDSMTKSNNDLALRPIIGELGRLQALAKVKAKTFEMLVQQQEDMYGLGNTPPT